MDSDIRQLLASLVPIKEDASIKDAVVMFHYGTKLAQGLPEACDEAHDSLVEALSAPSEIVQRIRCPE